VDSQLSSCVWHSKTITRKRSHVDLPWHDRALWDLYWCFQVTIAKENPSLAFYSCKLSDAQKRYKVIELEILSILETLQEFLCILLGHQSKIYTVHKNHKFNNFTSDHVHHWWLIVEEYSPTIYYIKRVHNIITNILSRVPQRDTSEPEVIESCLFIETEHFPLACVIIAQAQAENTQLQETLKQFLMEYKQHIHHEQLIILVQQQNCYSSWTSNKIDWMVSWNVTSPRKLTFIKSMMQHFHWTTWLKIFQTSTRNAKNVKYSNDNVIITENFWQHFTISILGTLQSLY